MRENCGTTKRIRKGYGIESENPPSQNNRHPVLGESIRMEETYA